MLALADFVIGDGLLPAALKSLNFRIALLCMFLAHAAIYPFAPQVEAAALKFFAHEGDNARFGQAKLGFDGLKGRAIFPGHLDDAVYIGNLQCYALMFLRFHFTLTADP